MDPELEEYFKKLGCDSEKLPAFKERDAEIFLRHRAMCRKCSGLENCEERGHVMLFSLSLDKKDARPAVASCRLREADDARRRAEKLFSEAAIPPALRRCRLENYVTKGRGPSVELAKAEAVRAVNAASSLALAGGVGTGKTHLAAAVVLSALNQGRSALFISAIGYLERLRSTFERKQTDLYAEMVNHVKSVSCLAIDDLGAEKPSAWTVARIYDVINTRVERGLQTVITTNFPSTSALARHLETEPLGAKRIVSRLVSFGWVNVEGKDYREQIPYKAAYSHTLTDRETMTDKVTDRETVTDTENNFLKKLLPHFEKQQWIDNASAREICGKSSASVKRYLRRLTALCILEANGVNKNRLYRLNGKMLS